VRRLQSTIQVTVGSIALLCLVLGGTTLMSLMVANVRDRVTEIGLRRALGATRERHRPALRAGGHGGHPGGGADRFGWARRSVLWLLRERFPVPLDLNPLVVIIPALLGLGLGRPLLVRPRPRGRPHLPRGGAAQRIGTPMSPAIHTVMFDLGVVLVHLDYEPAIRRALPLCDPDKIAHGSSFLSLLGSHAHRGCLRARGAYSR
jgi:hypothetical protein